MNFLIHRILLLSFILSITGCVQGVKTGVVQKDETSYLKFTGGTRGNDYGAVSIIIDDGKYSFDIFTNDGNVNTAKKQTLYKINPGKHRIQIYRDNNLLIDRVIFVENQVTTEINIPWDLNHSYYHS